MENLYELTDFNPIGENEKKTQIILSDTKRDYKNYIQSLRYRYNKKNPYLPHYVITKTGDIYNIMDPKMYSNYMENEDHDKKSIIICLENFGWLKKNTLEASYSNWIGDIYKKKVYEKKWKSHFFWDRYEDKQIVSLTMLIKELSEKFKIPAECLGHNVRQEGVEYFKGIVARSNYDSYHKDVNPAFDFKLLKELLEND
jgi:N-acetyl-anhydromuramyl-L-alanine amidase AmpD